MRLLYRNLMLHITGGGLSHRGDHDHHNPANTVLSAQTKVEWDEKIIHSSVFSIKVSKKGF